ncbi:hypothetical protein [Neoroseomonas soli]|uniref:Growth inhibitor PemK n=1 Tax=Neoroseomonas soli TaxID=1081025 RepID=A0A9X9WTQ3_9PROT|nr:hypothetical protein [Neoroseomonas soli]MBR0670532.1 hypothetical protein [Neoroseomonas soli]
MRSDKPTLPVIGDVIRYAYLWSHEHAAGREEGSKDRPAAVVALLRGENGRDEVVVFPITSTAPVEDGAGVEIPAATRARLGLQSEPCWVVVTEANVFAWPGPDLRRPDTGENDFVYGSLPHALMATIRQAFAAWRARKGARTIRRTE